MTMENNTEYILFLDDVRSKFTILNMIPIQYHNKILPNRQIILIKNYEQFVNIITQRGLPVFISFDHDLAPEHYLGSDRTKYSEKTGHDCLKWLIKYCIKHKEEFPSYYIHSMNPVGKDNMETLIINYDRYKNQ